MAAVGSTSSINGDSSRVYGTFSTASSTLSESAATASIPAYHRADAHPDDPHANDPFTQPRQRPPAHHGVDAFLSRNKNIGDAPDTTEVSTHSDDPRDSLLPTSGAPPVTFDTAHVAKLTRAHPASHESIDWSHDLLRASLRRRAVLRIRGFRGLVSRGMYAVQGWILVTIVGVVAAVFAAFIDVASEWLSDLKEGYCAANVWKGQATCCPISEDPTAPCSWTTWGIYFSRFHPSRDPSLEFWFGFAAYTLVGCAMCATAAGMVKYLAPYAAGSGIPEVKTILGGFVLDEFLSVPTLFVKTLGLSLGTASGVNLGKEGPLVHVACAIGNIATKLFPKYDLNEAKRREILSAASAAGVSVAFGAPIGGVLFALEEVSTFFGPTALFRSFFCALVGAFTLRMINPFGTGKIVLYEVDFTIGWRIHDVPFFILLGILGGLVGSFVIHANMRVARIRKYLGASRWPIRDVVTVTIVTAVWSYGVLTTRANLGRLVGNLFRECQEVDEEFKGLLCGDGAVSETVAVLLWSFMVKAFLLTFTIGIKIPAGIFLPPLAIGALAGRALGMVIQTIQESDPTNWYFSRCSAASPKQQCISPGLYALVGAAAALGGVTRMTVSLAVIVFELTGVLDYILPIMFGIMVSKWVGDAFGTESIYEGLITVNKLPYLSTRIDYVHPYHASDIMRGLISITSFPSYGATLDDLRRTLLTHTYHHYPIIDGKGMLLGVISARDLWCAVEEARGHGHEGTTPCSFLENEVGSDGVALGTVGAGMVHLDETPSSGKQVVNFRSWVDTTPFCVQSEQSVQVIIDYFVKLGLRYVVVVDTGLLKGVITKKDLLSHIEECENHPPHEPKMLESEFERKMAEAAAR
ncbi:hypothetical protein HDU93_006178 [Gonapodya sp. JEL0774]|nr:hypothetical protein HDU93_006178 [Gonapodya sp. JEL0774]